MKVLLVDVGNSRIKWAISQAGRLSAHGKAVHDGCMPAEVCQAWLTGEPPARVIIANVASEEYAQLLEAWVQGQWSLNVEYIVVDPGYSNLKLAYSDATKFGVDRWLALIAARSMSSTAVAVIDVGTAVTVDVLSAQGSHLGGVIIPGLGLMRQSLQQKTSAIQPGKACQKNATWMLLGQDTETCIACGSLYALAGAVEHMLARVEAQTGARLSVIICGGDAEVVQAELKIESRHISDLVLQGMQILKGVCE